MSEKRRKIIAVIGASEPSPAEASQAENIVVANIGELECTIANTAGTQERCSFAVGLDLIDRPRWVSIVKPGALASDIIHFSGMSESRVPSLPRL